MSQSIFGSLLGTNAAQQQQGLGQQGLMGAAQGLGLSAQQQQYMTQQQYASVQQMYANQVQLMAPALWAKVNPFLPFDREFARLELTRILLDYGEGKFDVPYVDISRHTEVGAAVNGLHALGLVSMEARGSHFECQITERGLTIVKEET